MAAAPLATAAPATAPLATAAPRRPVGTPSPVGLWYGNTGTSSIVPTADQLIELYRANRIEKMWLCCPTSQAGEVILESIKTNRDIEVVLYIPATEVPSIARDAPDWIKLITDYQTVIAYVCLGEVADRNNNSMTMIGPAMDKIHSINTISPIKVSTLVDVKVIFGSYEPKKVPSSYTFVEEYKKVLSEVFTRLGTSTPLFVKTFPNCFIRNNIELVNYHLDKTALPYMIDKGNPYTYVFDAMVDSISYAINEMGFSNVNISVVSGWPTARSRDATIDNAKTYNCNLLRHINEATPLQTTRIDHFIFSVVDEDQLITKDGLDWKHFGTFTLQNNEWNNKTFPTADSCPEAA